MIYTTTLLTRGSFLGSLISKIRQVVKHDTKHIQHKTKPNNNTSTLPAISTSTHPIHAATINDIGDKSSKPVNAANISNSSPVAAKTLEEQIGLPPRPKKPLTPYFRFMREQRPKILKEEPKISTTDVVRLLSKRWGTVEPSIKERLQEEYRKDQEKYIEQRMKYDSKLSDEQRAEIKHLKQEISEAKERRLVRKRIRDLGRPKKPASAFFRFITEERVANPQTSQQTYRQWHQKSTAKWTRLSDAEKEKYLQESRKELDKYKKAISLWEEKMIRLGHVDVVRHGNLIDPPEPKSRKSQSQKTQEKQ